MTGFYFLIKNKEVVYIGKTEKGLFRPLSHKNKDYDVIKVMYVDELVLSLIEDLLICKYRPKYNLEINETYSMLKTRNLLREAIGCDHFTVKDLKKIIKDLNIEVITNECGKDRIKINDVAKIVKEVRYGRK